MVWYDGNVFKSWFWYTRSFHKVRYPPCVFITAIIHIIWKGIHYYQFITVNNESYNDITNAENIFQFHLCYMVRYPLIYICCPSYVWRGVLGDVYTPLIWLTTIFMYIARLHLVTLLPNLHGLHSFSRSHLHISCSVYPLPGRTHNVTC